MADEIDVMQEVEQRLLDERIKAQTRKEAQPLPDPYCEACGEEIEPGRRKALPYATMCASCATIAEQRMKKR